MVYIATQNLNRPDMKKALIILFAAALALPVFATNPKYLRKKGSQQWIVLGARANVANTWLLNKNMMNDKSLKYKPSFGGSGGIMLGLHLTEVFAIEGECLYSVYNQKLASNDSISWTSKTSLAYIEIPVMLRFDFENFKYLELGVKFGILNSAKYSASFPDFPQGDVTNEDVKKAYDKNTSIVFGWGTGVWGNGGLLISMGVRLGYGISDIISDEGGRGDDYYLGDGTKKSYQKTNTASAALHLNIDFDLGWFVSSNCGRNHKFVLFGH
jgi:hypothetical protein